MYSHLTADGKETVITQGAKIIHVLYPSEPNDEVNFQEQVLLFPSLPQKAKSIFSALEARLLFESIRDCYGYQKESERPLIHAYPFTT